VLAWRAALYHSVSAVELVRYHCLGLARFVLGQHIAQDRHADAQNAGFINEGVLLYSV